VSLAEQAAKAGAAAVERASARAALPAASMTLAADRKLAAAGAIS
jgi:hypothetical protein